MDNAEIKIEDLLSVNPSEMIKNLLSRLKDRERDIIARRHGLSGAEKEILEGIGKLHNLTRERVRQIESAGLKKVRETGSEKELTAALDRLLKRLIENHGGMMEKNHFFRLLSHYGLDGAEAAKKDQFRNFYSFLVFKVLDGFEEVNKGEIFLPHIKLAGKDTAHLAGLAAAIKEEIAKRGKVMTAAELFAIAKEAARSAGIEIKGDYGGLDLSRYYANHPAADESGISAEKKMLHSVITAARAIDKNVFGHWGLSGWAEIRPKNLNEKIYLILKNEKRPLHFSEIAKKIDEMYSDRKKTNVASAHNELILDDKFVLVGRGMYGLNEWGLKEGTVAEIISRIIRAEEASLSKEEIIERVLKERMVKKTTIALALANKDRFVREDGGYRIRVREIS
jgi:hypothetical protein